MTIRLALLTSPRCLDLDPGIEVLAAAPDPASLARRLDGRKPDVLVLDDDPSRALALCRRVKDRCGAPRVLLFTAHATPALTLAARAAGVDALVDERASARALSAAIRAVALRTPALSGAGT